MNIWLLQTGEHLPIENDVRKMRTALLADQLLARGHRVLWWASAFDHQRRVMLSRKDQDLVLSERYAIRVLHGCGYRKNISVARYVDHLLVALKFRVQAKKCGKPDVLVASMPDHLLAYEAARYAVKNGIPFIVDIRDLWPDTFLDRFRKVGLPGVGKVVLALDFARLTFLLKSADALVAMSKGILQWGLHKVGRIESAFDRVFYLGYRQSPSESPAGADGSLEVPAWLRGRQGQKVFVFIGTFGVSYELELILDAAKRFEKSGRSDICFVLAGEGEKADLVRRKASGLRNVVLPGWIGQKEIVALLCRSHAGLVACRSVKDAMPNKPFEYLSAGLPLISSLEGEMAELVEQYQFGLNYLPGDLDGLCLCIERLASDSSLHEKMSRNASAFFAGCGDADKIYAEYAGYIEHLVESKDRNGSGTR